MVRHKVVWFRVISCCMALLLSGNLAAIEKQMVMGAGPSTAAATLFFKNFSKTAAASGYEFEVVPRSIKHAGGIRASDKYLFGRTGRPLNEKEQARNKREIFIARIPLSMVVGEQAGVESVSLEQLADIFTGKITHWNQLGGADEKILLVGRESSEAAFSVLKKQYPFFSHAKFDKKFTRDHQVVNFLKSKKGAYALAFGARSNFDSVHYLKVTGFEAGVSLGLVYDARNEKHPLVQSVREYAKSKIWKNIVTENDFLAPGMK